MPYATRDAVHVHYTDTGHPEHGTVILLHPLLMDTRVWDHQQDVLTEAGYRVLAVDSRCHGQTIEDREPFDLWNLADDAWAVADHAGAERVALAGISMGAFVAMRMALRRRSRVTGLFLVAASAGVYPPDQRQEHAKVFLHGWFGGGAPLEAIIPQVAQNMIGGDRAVQRLWLERWRNYPPGRMYRSGQALLDRENLDVLLPDITAPALLIHGSGDQAYTRTQSDQLAALLGGPTTVETVLAEGAAQVTPATHPELVNPLLLEFLAGLG